MDERYKPTNVALSLDLLTGEWKRLANMTTVHAGADCTVKDGKLWVVAGGNVNVEVYDIESNTWTQAPSFPQHHETELQYGHLFQDSNSSLYYLNNQIAKVFKLEDFNGWVPFNWYTPVSHTRRHWMNSPMINREILKTHHVPGTVISNPEFTIVIVDTNGILSLPTFTPLDYKQINLPDYPLATENGASILMTSGMLTCGGIRLNLTFLKQIIN